MATEIRPIADGVLDRIASIVGDRGVIADEAGMAPYLIDERKVFKGKAAMVVRPGSVDEVARIVALCNETKTPIVPQGGNTSLVGAATPYEHGNEIIVSLTRLNAVRDVDALNYTITVDAGVILADVQKAAAEADRLFPLSLGGEGTAVIGGNLSTNAGGTGVLRYGNARELVLGIEVVLPDGRVWDGLSRLRKDNTGYDLKHLFVGAEGTLGIITGAVLKLFPKPKDVQTCFVAIRDPSAATELLARARAISDDRVTAFEWIPRRPLDYVLRNIADTRDPLPQRYDHNVLLELSSAHASGALRETLETILGEAMQDGLVLDAAIAESQAQAAAMWKIRETIPEAQRFEGRGIHHDVSIPVSRVPDFIAEANAAIAQAAPDARICPFGHVGDGNIHYNVTQPEGGDGDAFYARKGELNAIVHGIVASMGGSISAEHGIGRLKRDELPQYKSPVALELMRALKRTLDPNGIMNPGKVL